ncbi:uncharacterized protein LOC116007870 [Ipomoea triloba]|uniref:uncharacterized protein LOC116007870 n=1 Tax=Ipomoea triloba TaxID=35885 RepID=UPI00125E1A0F|nr:uncharacterized protein LOC116007870 [Ipomoea triloba]
MKLMFWNVRGLLSSRRRLRRIVRRENLSLLAVSEPLISLDQADILARIYAKHSRGERQCLWNQLSSILSLPNPVLIGGDFNVIAEIAEYKGNATPDLNSIADFSSFISSHSLFDLPTLGGTYTWTGVRSSGTVWKRLDRFLLNADFRDFFSGVTGVLLNRTTSDHSPIIFSGCNANMSAPKQFRFQKMWTTHKNFLDLVQANWQEPHEGYGMRALAFKLKRLKSKLRDWNRSTFGNIFDKKYTIGQFLKNTENNPKERVNAIAAIEEDSHGGCDAMDKPISVLFLQRIE